MSVLTDFRERLVTDQGLTGMLSAADAVYCGFVPQSAQKVQPPYLIFDLLSDPGHYHLGGAAGVGSPSIQVGCWGRTPEQADALADALVDSLSASRARLGGRACHGAFKKDRRGPIPSDPQDGGSGRDWEVQVDFEVWHA
jgi:hypothetical protein